MAMTSRGALMALAGALAASGWMGGFATVAPAHAATGGHQVSFVLDHWCDGTGSLRSVSVSGTNQAGRRVTWSGPSSDGRSILTRSWWWIGDITIRYATTTRAPGDGAWRGEGYVPAEDDRAYLDPGQAAVDVDCAGTRKWVDVVVTSEHYSPACVSRNNPPGHYTLYTHYDGYVYVGVGESWRGYSIGANGKSLPREILKQYGIPDCG